MVQTERPVETTEKLRPTLSDREIAVLQGLIEGLTTAEIASGIRLSLAVTERAKQRLALKFRVNPADNRFTPAVVKAYLCRAITEAIDSGLLTTDHLPSRFSASLNVVECEILEGMASGKNIFDLSRKLGIKVEAGETHLRRICKKCAVKNVFMAVACWADG